MEISCCGLSPSPSLNEYHASVMMLTHHPSIWTRWTRPATWEAMHGIQTCIHTPRHKSCHLPCSVLSPGLFLLSSLYAEDRCNICASITQHAPSSLMPFCYPGTSLHAPCSLMPFSCPGTSPHAPCSLMPFSHPGTSPHAPCSLMPFSHPGAPQHAPSSLMPLCHPGTPLHHPHVLNTARTRQSHALAALALHCMPQHIIAVCHVIPLWSVPSYAPSPALWRIVLNAPYLLAMSNSTVPSSAVQQVVSCTLRSL